MESGALEGLGMSGMPKHSPIQTEAASTLL